jgi:hypothetical protein
MPNAAPEAVQEQVAYFVDMLSDRDYELLPDSVRIEATPISTIQLCEPADEAERCSSGIHGYHVLTVAPLKFNDTRVMAIIEGWLGRDHFCHFVDAMDGTPKMDAVRIPSELWDWTATIDVTRDAEDEDAG